MLARIIEVAERTYLLTGGKRKRKRKEKKEENRSRLERVICSIVVI